MPKTVEDQHGHHVYSDKPVGLGRCGRTGNVFEYDPAEPPQTSPAGSDWQPAGTREVLVDFRPKEDFNPDAVRINGKLKALPHDHELREIIDAKQAERAARKAAE